MYENMTRAGYDKEPEKLAVFDVSLDTVKYEFGQIYEEEDIEYLLNRIFEYRKNEKQFVGFPYEF
jgi:hypothetical protein